MARQRQWYRRKTRVYVWRPGGVRQIKAARKLAAELGMESKPWGELETGPRKGRYFERGRLYCRSCDHLAVHHGPSGCDVKGCLCTEARELRP